MDVLLGYDDYGLMYAYSGETIIHTWRFSDFEKYLDCTITFEMYGALVDFVEGALTHAAWFSLVNGEYVSDGAEIEAIDYYYALDGSNESTEYLEDELEYIDEMDHDHDLLRDQVFPNFDEDHEPPSVYLDAELV